MGFYPVSKARGNKYILIDNKKYRIIVFINNMGGRDSISERIIINYMKKAGSLRLFCYLLNQINKIANHY